MAAVPLSSLQRSPTQVSFRILKILSIQKAFLACLPTDTAEDRPTHRSSQLAPDSDILRRDIHPILAIPDHRSIFHQCPREPPPPSYTPRPHPIGNRALVEILTEAPLKPRMEAVLAYRTEVGTLRTVLQCLRPKVDTIPRLPWVEDTLQVCQALLEPSLVDRALRTFLLEVHPKA